MSNEETWWEWWVRQNNHFPKMACVWGIRGCNKGIEEWMDSDRFTPQYRRDQLVYYHNSRSKYLEQLKKYRR